jgi:uncharacterized 2Fe-2S/4Fe-4S cluster protein (DUF4445 family)
MSLTWERRCMKHSPLVFSRRMRIDPPSTDDKTADKERFLDQLEKAGMTDVEVPLNILRRLPEELRSRDFEISVTMGVTARGLRVLDISREVFYGLAIDIGSTNIECSLFHLVSGEKISRAARENPQVRYGPDVLTRVQKAMMGESSELSRVLLDGINTQIEEVCKGSGISSKDVLAAVVAGNTIESHFFLGLDVRNIPLSPYVPAVNSAVFAGAEETGLKVHENAVIYVFPNAGSYVGGDIISGMIFSGIYREETPALFIDVGTNVEITLGCREWIMTGAGAAGPALEGGVTGIGKTAERGTISGVRIDRLSKKIDFDVIGGEEPSGICGSGLIDLVSEMFSAGVIDRSGTLSASAENVRERDGEMAYLIYQSDEKELYLTQPEIKNFILSKAAMFSFLHVFVRSVGLTFRDIRKVYIAGALGCGINPESAINIGMLPDIPRERFVPLGNAALGGAEMVLLHRDLLKEVDGVAARITYREMNEDGELMSVLQGAMFIPHTDPDLLRG